MIYYLTFHDYCSAFIVCKTLIIQLNAGVEDVRLCHRWRSIDDPLIFRCEGRKAIERNVTGACGRLSDERFSRLDADQTTDRKI